MTTIVAEPGCTAEGHLQPMLDMVHLTAACGADVFKAQWTSDPTRMADRRNAGAQYERFYRWLAFPVEWHAIFRERCTEAGIRYACTAFLPEDVATLEPYVSSIKVASFECQDDEMLSALAPVTKDVWISTGMASRSEVRRIAERAYSLSHDTTLLQCVSRYPAPLDALNLSVLHSVSGEIRGFSDHSDPSETFTGAFAVCAGARLVEAHIRMDDADRANPDVPHAMTGDQFEAYVSAIRQAEACLGDGIKRQQPCEQDMAKYRVGVHA